jgi:hypothetical protein
MRALTLASRREARRARRRRRRLRQEQGRCGCAWVPTAHPWASRGESKQVSLKEKGKGHQQEQTQRKGGTTRRFAITHRGKLRSRASCGRQRRSRSRSSSSSRSSHGWKRPRAGKVNEREQETLNQSTTVARSLARSQESTTLLRARNLLAAHSV